MEHNKVPSKAMELAYVRALTTSGAARSIRMGARLSLGDVAQAMPTTGEPPRRPSRSTILRWERGERLPRGEAAVEYGRLLDRLMKQR